MSHLRQSDASVHLEAESSSTSAGSFLSFLLRLLFSRITRQTAKTSMAREELSTFTASVRIAGGLMKGLSSVEMLHVILRLGFYKHR